MEIEGFKDPKIKDNLGLDSLKLVYSCVLNDVKQFQNLIKVENEYCRKVEHALHLTNFISSVKPFVCLNFDPQYNGFNLVRQDKCDKHQPNPLLTGQLLFGIVQTNNPNNGKAGKGGHMPAASISGASKHTASQLNQGFIQNQNTASRRLEQISGALPDGGQSKLKHYQIKRIDL